MWATMTDYDREGYGKIHAGNIIVWASEVTGPLGLMSRVFTHGLGDRGSIPG